MIQNAFGSDASAVAKVPHLRLDSFAAERERERETDRQTDRQTYRHRHRHRHTYIHAYIQADSYYVDVK